MKSRRTPPPRPTPSHLVSIPPGLRRAVRDAVITPDVAVELAPYLTPANETDRLDKAATAAGKVIAITLFVLLALIVFVGLCALLVRVGSTITG